MASSRFLRSAPRWAAAASVGILGTGSLMGYYANADSGVGAWSSSDVSKWLAEKGLSMYSSRFRQENVDGDILINDLTYDIAVSDLGVKQLHAKKLMRGIDDLKPSDYPDFKSTHCLAAKHLSKDVWNSLKNTTTSVSQCTLESCIRAARGLEGQHIGIYAGDEECYTTFAPLFDKIIQEYHSVGPNDKHKTDMDYTKLVNNIEADCPILSTRIRVGRNISGYGLSPSITKEQRVELQELMKGAFDQLEGDLAGKYYPLPGQPGGMTEEERVQMVKDRFMFVDDDPCLQVAGMTRDWPEGRGIFVSNDKKFLVWVNEEDQLRIISMQKGGDVKEVFSRLSRGITSIEDYIKTKGKKFIQYEKYGYCTSCPTNLGTGMRASVMLELPGWKAEATANKFDTGKKYLQKFYNDNKMGIQARGSRGESKGETGCTYDLSNMYRLGYSEVQLVQQMIDGIAKTWDLEKAKRSCSW